MAERGNSTHGRRLDEEMKQETQGLTRNAVPDHVEEWRQPEPMADDTDSAEVQDAMGVAQEAEATALPSEGDD
ncbi:hypothetical protein [Arthrobacter sp. 7Tela_A1]|uniref:hypothetical protein n=1 Tax=Arthrobacter sp. 7Tela_A1 TaxID=3093745 RepID=UPI003BB74D3B